MRRAPAWLTVLGTLLASLALPAAAPAANVWVTFAAGLPGGVIPTASTEFYFENPHAPNIAVTELSGGVSAEATTGGGSTFFGGVGTPVLLNVGDGSAYIANGSAPPGAKTSGAGGGTSASAGPTAGGSVPSNAALLGINLAEPNTTGGSRTLSASVRDANGNLIQSGSLEVPDGGWWVIGLSPFSEPTPPPPIDPPPPVDPIPDPPSSAPPPTGNPPATTPEPGTLAMAAIGSSAFYAWRRARRML